VAAQGRGRTQAKDVVHVVDLAVRHHLRAGVVAVAVHQDLDPRPDQADTPDQAAQKHAHLTAVINILKRRMSAML
jgi:hypothetical protein